jgi:serine/threonine-protein kinase
MDDEAPIIGRLISGRFRITGFVGEGAMAAVYRGAQEAEPHDVALKIMHPHLLTDPTFVGRFRREAKAAARIDHPNTVRVIDAGVDGKLLYIAMELLAGRDLFELLMMERRLSEARAARILIEVTSALSAAHEKGIVHRDLKPENIMLVPDPDRPGEERVKVLDFGIAKLLEQEVPSGDGPAFSQFSLTSAGSVVGTPAYMSPEQCRGEAIDDRSDVYACGVLLYQLVSGRLPFTSKNAMDLAVQHVREPPPPLAQIVPGIHPGLAATIDKALRKWPMERHRTAAEFCGELRALLPELRSEPLSGALLPAEGAPRRRASLEAITLRPGVLSASDIADEDTHPADEPPIQPAQKEEAPRSPPRPVAVAAAEPKPVRKQPAREPPGMRAWLLVPAALVLGLLMGAAAFLLLGK